MGRVAEFAALADESSAMRIVTSRAVIVFLSLGLGFLAGRCPLVRDSVALTSLSPDDALCVKLVEVESSFRVARNFRILLTYLGSGEARTVFHSPDEGRPIGSERVVWSADSSRFLLVGRHFIVSEGARLPTGEAAYLMMDVPTGQIWCNATQQSSLRGFGIEDLRSVNWHGWTPFEEPVGQQLPEIPPNLK